MGIFTRLKKWLGRNKPSYPAAPIATKVPVNIVGGPGKGLWHGVAHLMPKSHRFHDPEHQTFEVCSCDHPGHFYSVKYSTSGYCMCGTYHYRTGKHVTWGQGRNQVDEYPQLTQKSLHEVWDSDK